MTRKSRNQGSIVVTTMWLIAVLALCAISLGHRVAVDLWGARSGRDGLKAYYRAYAGVQQALYLLQEDYDDTDTQKYDSDEECGIKRDKRELEKLFSRNWAHGQENFIIGYQEDGAFRYGIRDETRFININITEADTVQQQLVGQVLARAGADADSVEDIVKLALDWIAKESPLSVAKKEEFVAPQEFLAVLEYFFRDKNEKDYPTKARDIYAKIEPYITVFSGNKININTASSEILTMVFTAANTELSDPCSEDKIAGLVKAIDSYRSGGLLEEHFTDSNAIWEKIKSQDSGLDSDQQALFDKVRNNFDVKSDTFRITVTARAHKAMREVTAVYNRSDGVFLSWQQK